jgi:hypothetical protein
MAQQTAVEWLQEVIINHLSHEQQMQVEGLFQQAKQMEADKIVIAYETGWVNGDLKKAPRRGSDYYDQTFKNKRK